MKLSQMEFSVPTYRLVRQSAYEASSVFLKVVYRVPPTGTRSPRIAYRQSAINNKLAPKPTPKPNPNP